MEIDELLRWLTATMDRLELRYLVTGSTATFAYGEPRFTNDIGVVVELPVAAIEAFCQAFPKDQFASPRRRSAALSSGDFNSTFCTPRRDSRST